MITPLALLLTEIVNLSFEYTRIFKNIRSYRLALTIAFFFRLGISGKDGVDSIYGGTNKIMDRNLMFNEL